MDIKDLNLVCPENHAVAFKPERYVTVFGEAVNPADASELESMAQVIQQMGSKGFRVAGFIPRNDGKVIAVMEKEYLTIPKPSPIAQVGPPLHPGQMNGNRRRRG